MLKVRLLLFSLILPCMLFGRQKAQIDSLLNLLSNPKTIGIKRADVLNILADKYARTDSAKAFSYAMQARVIAEKQNYAAGQADAYRTMGLATAQKNNLTEAMLHFNKAIKFYTIAKSDSDVGIVYSDIGSAYVTHNKRPEAIEALLKAERLHRKINDQKNLLVDLNQLGVAYYQDAQPKKAIEYYVQAAALADKTKDNDYLSSIYNNLGLILFSDKNYNQAKSYYLKVIDLQKTRSDFRNLGIAYLNLANVYIDQSNYKQGLLEYENALAAFTKINFTKGIQVCYNNMGAVSIRKGDYQEAIPLLEKSLEISFSSKNYTGVALTQQNLAYIYTKLRQYPKAASMFDEAEQSAGKYKSNASVYGEIFNHRSMLDSAMGNYKEAFFQRNKYLTIKDSLLNEKLSKQINELQTKYDTQKKQGQIDLLSRQNTIQQLNLKNQDLQLLQNTLTISRDKLEIDKNRLYLANQQLKLKNNQNLLVKKQLESQTRGQKIKLLNEENTNQQLQISKRNVAIYTIIGVVLLIGIIAYQFYNRYKLKQEALLQATVIQEQIVASRGIIDAEERERKRISGDLHDGLGQLLSAVKMNTEVLIEKFLSANPEANELGQKLLAMADESCVEVRSIAHQMTPNALLRSGLVSAVRDFVNQIPADRIAVSLETEGLNERLESSIETVLYRVIQESVNNVVKHAKASRIDISLMADEKEINVTIEDNGVGFDMNNKELFDGIGLRNMKTRIEYLRGSVDISSEPGNGTLVAIYVPLDPAEISLS
ncbi:MAG: sensor histidine kinase [Bacteroidota bacterium]